jgi:hypothetical protein
MVERCIRQDCFDLGAPQENADRIVISDTGYGRSIFLTMFPKFKSPLEKVNVTITRSPV